jgi:hypothetical protein
MPPHVNQSGSHTKLRRLDPSQASAAKAAGALSLVPIAVEPQAKLFCDGVYIVVLGGTASLSGEVRAWVRVADEWREAVSVPGANLLLDVPRSLDEGPEGTSFEAAIYSRRSRPGHGTAMWNGTYRVRNTQEGPMLQEEGGSLAIGRRV